MKKHLYLTGILLRVTYMVTFCIVQYVCIGQNIDNSTSISVPSEYFDDISKKSDGLSKNIDAETTRALEKFRKRERKILSKLYKSDSNAANNIFTNTQQQYNNLEEKLNHPQQITQYIPFLDTIKTSLKFLDKNKQLLEKTANVKAKLDASMDKINGLESQIQKAEEVKQFLKAQKEFLNEQLSKLSAGVGGQIKGQIAKLNKDVYYYGQQLKEYKEMIKDSKKMERKAIDLISHTKMFQDFMRKNSMLASLFRMPSDDPTDPAFLQSLSGLQSRTDVNQLIQTQLGSGDPNAMQQLQSNVQQAQEQLHQLKDKLSKFGNSASDEDMPNFKPNNQRIKSFLKRMEYGINIQSQRSTPIFPVTSDIGLSAGYKINDKSIIGIGASYKMGWGKDIQHVNITNQGAGIRSYVDYKLKKTFWLSGGFEMNYRSEFTKIEQLKVIDAWSQSGLIGISKKLPITTKFLTNTKVQLLWDFLSYHQMPRTQPLVFRVGYGIK